VRQVERAAPRSCRTAPLALGGDDLVQLPRSRAARLEAALAATQRARVGESDARLASYLRGCGAG
jgi:hypothetical protein